MKYDRWIFILGCERSGSTLMSTFVGLHQETDFYFEPFSAVQNKAFRGWKERYDSVESSEENLADIHARLSATKRLRNEFLPAYWEDGLFRPYFKLREKLSRLLRNKLDRSFFHLNNYRFQNDFHFKKERILRTGVVKELRLNLDWPLLDKAFPESRVIVSYRHPSLQVSSMLKTMEKGSLIELNQQLPMALANFADKFGITIPDNLRDQLLTYITVSYSVLLEDLEACNTDFLCVSVEEAGSNYTSVFKNVLQWSGLSWNYEQEVMVNQLSGQEQSRSPLDVRKKIGYHAQLMKSGQAELFSEDFSTIKALANTTGLFRYRDLVEKEYFS